MGNFGWTGVEWGPLLPPSVDLAKGIGAITAPRGKPGLGNVLEISSQIGEGLKRIVEDMEAVDSTLTKTFAELSAPCSVNLAKGIGAITAPRAEPGLGNLLEISNQIGAAARQATLGIEMAASSALRFDNAIEEVLRPLAALDLKVQPDQSVGALLDGLGMPGREPLDLPLIPDIPERPEVELLRREVELLRGILEHAAPKPAGPARLGAATIIVLFAAGGIAAVGHLLPLGQAIGVALPTAFGAAGVLAALFKSADFRAGLGRLRPRHWKGPKE